MLFMERRRSPSTADYCMWHTKSLTAVLLEDLLVMVPHHEVEKGPAATSHNNKKVVSSYAVSTLHDVMGVGLMAVKL